TTGIDVPADFWMSADASANVDTGVPATDTSWSPGANPASPAGEAGSDAAHEVAVTSAGRHALTSAIVVVTVCTPMPLSAIVNSARPSTRFMIGPPSMTMTRLYTGSR